MQIILDIISIFYTPGAGQRVAAIRKALSRSFPLAQKEFLLTQKCKRGLVRAATREKGIFSGYYLDHSGDYAAKWSEVGG